MSLKYKVGDRVHVVEGGWGISDSDVESLSGEVFEVISYLPDGYFGEDGYLLKPSILTRFDYTPGEDGFIGGEALRLAEDLQTSNESGYLVQKISVENDVVSYAVSESTPNSTEEKKMQFKVGDKVKYVGTGWDDSFNRDVKYPVTEVWASGCGCDIDETPVSSRFYSDFQLVEEPQPEAQDNSWYERGELPPVGTVCEAWHNGCAQGVVQVRYSGGCMVLWNVKLKHEQCSASENYTFKPIRTPEQIAEEERSAYCDRIYSVLCKAERKNNRSDMAESLYDAGLRFVGEDK